MNPLESWTDEDLRDDGMLIVQLPTAQPAGDPVDLDVRHHLEGALEDALRSADAGWVDGGDIGSGTMNVYIVPTSKRALSIVVAQLAKDKLLPAATFVIRTADDEYRVLWPEGYTGSYTAENELYGLPERRRPS